jgi:hypothetical protein
MGAADWVQLAVIFAFLAGWCLALAVVTWPKS